MNWRRIVVAAVVGASAASAPKARAQPGQAQVRIAVGFGVDTTSPPNHDILTLYRSYMAARADTAQARSFWLATEQQEWPQYDLLASSVYQGFTHFTIVHLAPAVGLDSTYLIRILVSGVDDSTRDVSPLALFRVYATRQAGHWVLANALPRLTRAWHHDTLGPLTFVYPPAHRFDRRKAAATAAFVDSLAQRFGVPRPLPITYYFTDDMVETLAAAGLDFFPIGSDTVGGRANPWDRFVLIGSSSSGETYRHELAHIILAPLFDGARPHGRILEGLMTWVGGSAGLDYLHLLGGLQSYVRAHPELTLEHVLSDPPPRVGSLDVGYDGPAVLCAMVHDHGGDGAVRELVRAGPSVADVLGAAARLLGVPRDSVDARWRSTVLAATTPTER
jgi:hypothetical protein